jgi:hypothetical protein
MTFPDEQAAARYALEVAEGREKRRLPVDAPRSVPDDPATLRAARRWQQR